MLKGESLVIKDLLASFSGMQVLDLCSSSAAFYTTEQPHIYRNVVAPLEAHGCTVQHLDAKQAPGVDIVADCCSMEIVIDASFDLVLLCSALEHVSRPEEAIREAHRVLRPGGFLLASIPAIYPYHPDPIDTQLRICDRRGWVQLLGPRFEVAEFRTSPPEAAPTKYGLAAGVFATVVLAKSSTTATS